MKISANFWLFIVSSSLVVSVVIAVSSNETKWKKDAEDMAVSIDKRTQQAYLRRVIINDMIETILYNGIRLRRQSVDGKTDTESIMTISRLYAKLKKTARETCDKMTESIQRLNLLVNDNRNLPKSAIDSSEKAVTASLLEPNDMNALIAIMYKAHLDYKQIIELLIALDLKLSSVKWLPQSYATYNASVKIIREMKDTLKQDERLTLNDIQATLVVLNERNAKNESKRLDLLDQVDNFVKEQIELLQVEATEVELEELKETLGKQDALIATFRSYLEEHKLNVEQLSQLVVERKQNQSQRFDKYLNIALEKCTCGKKIMYWDVREASEVVVAKDCNFKGKDYIYAHTSSVDACGTECSKKDWCSHFTWVAQNTTCLMKQGLVDMKLIIQDPATPNEVYCGFRKNAFFSFASVFQMTNIFG